ncbi:hypothetical protein [Nocardia abscessus]|uniref:hypothetical protein n=1 Tax=Nocardia abscessus TaxID=120957 RepID=UPI00245653E9|nr:hypothetical protein [Nocardia abscessus]
MLRKRSNTSLVERPSILAVRQFLTRLDSAGSLVDDLLIGAHANSRGDFFMRMYRGQPAGEPTTYETLEHTIDTPRDSINVDRIIGRKPERSVHLLGCNLGNGTQFMTKFKEALGNSVVLTAPKHAHVAHTVGNVVFEYMAYAFRVRRKTAFLSRTAAIVAFQDKKFSLVEGATVPDGRWKYWIPQSDRNDIESLPTKTEEWYELSPLGVSIGSLTSLPTQREFRIDRTPFTQIFEFTSKAGALEMTEADARSALLGQDYFRPDHPWSLNERLGYDNFNSFWNGHDWNFGPPYQEKTRNDMWRRNLVGSRVEYTVVRPITVPIRPITDPPTRMLVFNLYPRRDGIPDGLNVEDSDYFTRV